MSYEPKQKSSMGFQLKVVSYYKGRVKGGNKKKYMGQKMVHYLAAKKRSARDKRIWYIFLSSRPTPIDVWMKKNPHCSSVISAKKLLKFCFKISKFYGYLKESTQCGKCISKKKYFSQFFFVKKKTSKNMGCPIFSKLPCPLSDFA